MDFNVLKYLIVIEKEGSLVRAAEKLNLSQPALSNAIRKLEQELKIELFTRGAKGMIPTDAGLRCIEYARLVLNGQEYLQRNLYEDSKRLIIGMTTTWTHILTYEAIPLFLKKEHNLDLVLVQDALHDFEQSLLNRSLDMVVIAIPSEKKPVKGVIYYPLLQDPILIAAPTDSALAAKSVDCGGDYPYLDPQYLQGQPLILPSEQTLEESVNKFLKVNHISNNCVFRCNQPLTRKHLCAVGAGVSFISQTFAKYDRALPCPQYFITDHTLPAFEVVLACREASKSNRVIMAFVRTVINSFRNNNSHL